jgi:hypothetical protein
MLSNKYQFEFFATAYGRVKRPGAAGKFLREFCGPIHWKFLSPKINLVWNTIRGLNFACEGNFSLKNLNL